MQGHLDTLLREPMCNRVKHAPYTCTVKYGTVVVMYFMLSVSGPVVCNLARLEQILFGEDNYLYMYVENLKMLGQTPCLREPTRNK